MFVYDHYIWCLYIVLKSAMMHINSLVFIVFLFNFLTKTFEIDNIDKVCEELVVSHYDCTKMQDN